MPLVEAELARRPEDGIMLYSFATAQAEQVYAEVDCARTGGAVHAIYIAGGPHASALPEQALQHFDFVVIGEGEETLPELLRAIAEGSNPAELAGVKGIAYRQKEPQEQQSLREPKRQQGQREQQGKQGKQGKSAETGRIKITERRPAVDLDAYPPFGKILAPLEISRGCPWGCLYCATPRLFGSCMRHRSIAVIERYARRHRHIRFTSPNSLAYGSDGRKPRLEKVEALLKALVEQDRPIYFGTFPSEVRPEFVTGEALEIIVKYCANRSLSLGGQSGSPSVLRSIGRGHSRDDIEAACDLCHEFDLLPQVDLIFGLPMEAEEDQSLTLDLARWIVARGGRVRAHLFTPLPGTPLYNRSPSPLSERVLGCLGKLALEGSLTGSWREPGRPAKDRRDR